MPTICGDDLQQYVRKLVLEHLGYRSRRYKGVEDNLNRQPDAKNDDAKRGEIQTS